MARFFLLYILLIVLSCQSDDGANTSPVGERNFGMGFTSWPYAPSVESVNDTYAFLQNNGDIYAEHIDERIPWNAWIDDNILPASFVESIDAKVAKREQDMKLLLSVSVLNTNREDLKEDWNGNPVNYNAINDQWIEDAYVNHVEYLVERLDPQYLVYAIEVNELLMRSPDKWEGFKLLMANVEERLRSSYPNLPMSQSITLHNLYQPEVANPVQYTDEISSYMNQNDFVAISYYPFFKNFKTKTEFQEGFDFLNAQTSLPIAVVETSHLAEDLIVPNLNINIPGNPNEQKDYLEVLLDNAAGNNYEFIIWWSHRDYDLLWETFPDELKDLGQIWRDTGLLDENGLERPAFNLWLSQLNSTSN